MRIEIATSSYNFRRYSRPWIARVTFESSKGDFHFGDWVGSPGENGLLLIEAEPGDVVANGQKDHRGRTSPPDYSFVKDDGTLAPLGDRLAAFRHYEARRKLEAETNRKEGEQPQTRINYA